MRKPVLRAGSHSPQEAAQVSRVQACLPWKAALAAQSLVAEGLALVEYILPFSQ